MRVVGVDGMFGGLGCSDYRSPNKFILIIRERNFISWYKHALKQELFFIKYCKDKMSKELLLKF